MGNIDNLTKRSDFSTSRQSRHMIFRPSVDELGGVIFMANQETMEDCFRFGVFGLPQNKWSIVQKVVPGLRLFLFEYEARELWGIFEASSCGSLNIEKAAYKSSAGAFPAQVRFATFLKCPSLSELEFRDAIKENYYSKNKFKFDLTINQVQRLCEIFCSKRNCLDTDNYQQKETYPDFSQEDRLLMDFPTTYKNNKHKNTDARRAWSPNLYCKSLNSRLCEATSEHDILPRVEFDMLSNNDCCPSFLNGRIYVNSMPLQVADSLNDALGMYRTNSICQDCFFENSKPGIHHELCTLDKSSYSSKNFVDKEEYLKCDYSLRHSTSPVMCHEVAIQDVQPDIPQNLYLLNQSFHASSHSLGKKQDNECHYALRHPMFPVVRNEMAIQDVPCAICNGHYSKGRVSVWSRLSARSEQPFPARSPSKRRKSNLLQKQDASPLDGGNNSKNLCDLNLENMDLYKVKDSQTDSNNALDRQADANSAFYGHTGYYEVHYVVNYKRRKDSKKLSENPDLEKGKRRKLRRPDFSFSKDGTKKDSLNSDGAKCCEMTTMLQDKDLYPLGCEKKSTILDTAILETVNLPSPSSREAEQSRCLVPLRRQNSPVVIKGIAVLETADRLGPSKEAEQFRCICPAEFLGNSDG